MGHISSIKTVAPAISHGEPWFDKWISGLPSDLLLSYKRDDWKSQVINNHHGSGFCSSITSGISSGKSDRVLSLSCSIHGIVRMTQKAKEINCGRITVECFRIVRTTL